MPKSILTFIIGKLMGMLWKKRVLINTSEGCSRFRRMFLYLASVARCNSSAILRFFHWKRVRFIPAACKVFLAKVIAQILCKSVLLQDFISWKEFSSKPFGLQGIRPQEAGVKNLSFCLEITSEVFTNFIIFLIFFSSVSGSWVSQRPY